MPDVCKLLDNAIKDEKDGVVFYKRLEQVIDKDNRWKIEKIRKDEEEHEKRLHFIKNLLKCE